MEAVVVDGVEYKFAKARDFEIVIRTDNGYINYTKLCQQVNGGKKPFYDIKRNTEFKLMCVEMEEKVVPQNPRTTQIEEKYELIKSNILI